MIYSREIFSLLATRLALFANEQVPLLSGVMRGDLTGAVVAMMPHIVERAIVIHSKLTNDVATLIAGEFISGFEAVCKITCNPGGFSNPIRKFRFNAAFHRKTSREYKKLKPLVDECWQAAQDGGHDSIDMFCFAVFVPYCEMSADPRIKLDHDEICKMADSIHDIVEEVHRIIDRS